MEGVLPVVSQFYRLPQAFFFRFLFFRWLRNILYGQKLYVRSSYNGTVERRQIAPQSAVKMACRDRCDVARQQNIFR